MAVRGVRGAIQVGRNGAAAIARATTRLLRRMVRANRIRPADVAYAYFTVTHDLTADFPARAARKLGRAWEHVPLLCSREIPVPNSMPRLLRVLLVVNTDLPPEKIRHCYVGAAARLRPDLKK